MIWITSGVKRYEPRRRDLPELLSVSKQAQPRARASPTPSAAAFLPPDAPLIALSHARANGRADRWRLDWWGGACFRQLQGRPCRMDKGTTTINVAERGRGGEPRGQTSLTFYRPTLESPTVSPKLNPRFSEVDPINHEPQPSPFSCRWSPPPNCRRPI